MGRGSIDHLIEIGWIKPSGRKNIPCKPTILETNELFIVHFGLKNISDLHNKDELKASGFLDKRSAIATISDLAENNDNNDQFDNSDTEDDTNLDDFIQSN